MAFPREALAYDDGFFDHLRALIEDEGIEMIVIGRPLSLGGTPTASTDFADDLFRRLSEAGPTPVVQHDERLTTTAAQRSLAAAGLTTRRQRSRIDSAAAVVMLQHFVESRHAL